MTALFALRRSQCREAEEWAADITDAVAAEVAAASLNPCRRRLRLLD
ncbi:hypothetical protein [Mycolicibacterium baixiangningiae]|nr:hypothetical protein [Mycolicibacterium baixiangningiae]